MLQHHHQPQYQKIIQAQATFQQVSLRLFEFDHSLTTLFPESECGFGGGKNNLTDVTKIELGKKKTSLGEYPWVALIGNG